MARTMTDLPTSLEQIISRSVYEQTKKEIDSFLQKFIKKRLGKIETVVKVTRKGNGIFSCFEDENPQLMKFQSIRDDEIALSERSIKGMRVLVFDDSVRTGGKMTSIIRDILRDKPKSVVVCVLLINDDAKKRLERTFSSRKIEIHSFRTFGTYNEQQLYFREFLLSFLDGLKSNMNTDFPLVTFTVTGQIDVDSINCLFEELTFNGITPEVSPIEDYLGLEEKKVFSIVWESYEPKEQDSKIFMDGVNQCKVRAYVRREGVTHKIELVAMIDPFVSVLDPDECQVSSLHPMKCVLNVLKKEEIEVPDDTDRFCHTCALYQIFSEFLEELADDVRRIFKKHGLSILVEQKRMPLTHIGDLVVTLIDPT